MAGPIRLLLADDHALLRQRTAELLRCEPDLVRVIRQAQAGESPLDPAIARKVVVQLGGGRGSGPADWRGIPR